MSHKYTDNARQLMTVAGHVIENLDHLWAVYQELFKEVDLNSPEANEVILSVIAELRENLIEMQDQVEGQIYLATGIYEPIPVDEVEDFEFAVLTTLAGLDTVDLEKYRIEGSSRE